jgi:hypothetical protein
MSISRPQAIALVKDMVGATLEGRGARLPVTVDVCPPSYKGSRQITFITIG